MSSYADRHDDVQPAALSLHGEPPRIRLVDVRIRRPPSGHVDVDVDLQRVDGGRVTGHGAGHASAFGDLRIAADATVAALNRAAHSEHRFELVGVKSVRAFDHTVVLVLIALVGGDGPSRLVGSAFAHADVAHAAVLAVLNATNRVFCRPTDA